MESIFALSHFCVGSRFDAPVPEALGLDPAISVNHAFTLLSERFEPWRKAHTASIYERVFYKEVNEKWYRLDDLREKELATAERAIVQALWKEVESTLGQSLF